MTTITCPHVCGKIVQVVQYEYDVEGHQTKQNLLEVKEPSICKGEACGVFHNGRCGYYYSE